ncbi:MAG: HAD family phosphatase [Candidatus Diapherotrites archaeon]|uniref:HAD family phosphatase n=1 Tax=Candidatus Iainarchaeum sp. TaxID=3101447 RepID=A0A8T3YLL4_9ARCH|nr:HAD family phosphatase [Candidatus Woesearchaeota archaeon]MBI4210935.1 HAD family phosphatase [Candidatus Diapherotrites archaeon]
MLEAVIFDFDGILVDTPEYYFKHMKSYLRAIHPAITDDDIAPLIGHTFDAKVNALNQKFGLRIERAHFAKAMNEKVRAEMLGSLVPNPDLLRLLGELDEAGLPLGIASSNSRHNILAFLERLGIAGRFSSILSYSDASVPKPSPEIYINAAESLGVACAHCAALEDTLAGFESAKGAGMKCIAMPNRFAAGHAFEGADIVVKDFKELSFERIRGLWL